MEFALVVSVATAVDNSINSAVGGRVADAVKYQFKKGKLKMILNYICQFLLRRQINQIKEELL